MVIDSGKSVVETGTAVLEMLTGELGFVATLLTRGPGSSCDVRREGYEMPAKGVGQVTEILVDTEDWAPLFEVMDRSDCDCNFFFVRSPTKPKHPKQGKFTAFSHSYHSVHKKPVDKPTPAPVDVPKPSCSAIGEECLSRSAANFFPTIGAGSAIQTAVQDGIRRPDQFIALLFGRNGEESLYSKLDSIIQGNASFAAMFRTHFTTIAVNVEVQENDPYHIDGGVRADERVVILTSMGELLGSQSVAQLLDPSALYNDLDPARLGDLQASAGNICGMYSHCTINPGSRLCSWACSINYLGTPASSTWAARHGSIQPQCVRARRRFVRHVPCWNVVLLQRKLLPTRQS
jgi:hypothetical protein